MESVSQHRGQKQRATVKTFSIKYPTDTPLLPQTCCSKPLDLPCILCTVEVSDANVSRLNRMIYWIYFTEVRVLNRRGSEQICFLQDFQRLSVAIWFTAGPIAEDKTVQGTNSE